jgi:hypothetical protein
MILIDIGLSFNKKNQLVILQALINWFGNSLGDPSLALRMTRCQVCAGGEEEAIRKLILSSFFLKSSSNRLFFPHLCPEKPCHPEG